jgi:DNA mismatch repair protein MutL
VRPCNADYGTSITVRDIFYKLPARRKFLRTVNTEMGHITEQFIRIALANTNLDLTLSHNGKELYHLSAGQSLKSRIAELFSTEITESLTEVSFDEKNIQLFALLGSPEVSRTNNKLQYTFLNGRFIRDRFISHAIKEAYRGYIEADRFPVAFLFIKMPCEDYDVNVHPTKIEVRFYNSNLIHSQILGAIREKLLAGPQDIRAKLPERSFQSQPAAKSERSEKVNQAMAEFFKKHRPQSQPQLGFSRSSTTIAPASAGKKTAGQVVPLGPQAPAKQKSIQIHNSYIVTEVEDGFVIVDQHALHERLLYNDLKRRLSTGKLESQKLLIPESFQITSAQKQALEEHCDIFEKMGIELAPFGPKTVAIHSFPTLLAKANAVGIVCDLLDLLAESGKALDAQTLLDEVINIAACKAAIKAGQQLTDNEIEQLLASGDVAELSGRCPHGRPTTIKFPISELEKQFKRT